MSNSPSTEEFDPAFHIPLAGSIKRFLRIRDGETLLDYGCGTGAMVKAMRVHGVNAWGCDLDHQAKDPNILQFISSEIPDHSYSWVMAQGSLDGLNDQELENLMPLLISKAWTGLFAVIAVDNEEGWSLTEWLYFLGEFDRSMIVSGCFYATGINSWDGSPSQIALITMRRH